MSDSDTEFSYPVDGCLESLKALDLFVESTLHGLAHSSQATGWIEVNKRLGKFKTDESGLVDAIERSRKLETFAAKEIAQGTPYLYGIAVVRISTILETLTDDLVFQRLRDGKFKADSEVLGSIKLPLREILGVDPEQQAEAILEELKQATKSRLKQGVGRFEALLGPVSLGGPVDDDVRKAIFECSQVRNLIVHRNAVVDSKFKSACPWITVELGQTLPLSRSHFRLYYNAAFWYGLEMQFRIDKFDCAQVQSDSSLADIQDLFLKNVKGFFNSRPGAI